MDTRSMIDPELIELLDARPNVEVTADTLEDSRRTIREIMVQPLESYARPDVAIEVRTIPGPAGAPDSEVTIYRPIVATRPLPVYLDIHGGGYIAGLPAGNGPADVRTAAELGCLVIAPAYRLAPEWPAPAAVEDCYAALAWLFTNADELGIDRTRVAIGGGSAGGGLAAALALLVRDRGEYPLCFQLLIYPMLDDRVAVGEPANPYVGEFGWTVGSNRFGWRAYLGQEPGSEGVSPYAAPARASDLSRLPPAYISVGAHDLFLDENIDYARRLLAAGVATELHVYPGAFHGSDAVATASVSIRSQWERRVALARALGVPAPKLAQD